MSDSVFQPYPPQSPAIAVMAERDSRAAAGSVVLYNSASVAVATFLGAPAAGSLLMAINYRRMGKTGSAITAFGIGVVVTALAVGLGYAVPQGVTVPLGLGLLFATRVTAEKMQGASIAQHVSLGGKLGSKWVAAGIGAVFLCLILGAVFLPIYTSSTHNKVIVGTKDEVFYRGTATQREAQSLGNALKAGGYFKDRGTSVFLEKGKEGTAISLVLKEGRWDDAGILATEEEAMREVADSVGGLPIHVRLIDSLEAVHKQGVVGRASADGKDEVFYFGQATEADGLALCRALNTEQYFAGRGASVMLSKDSDGTVMSFVVSDGFWNEEKHVAGFESVVRSVAPSVGGLPVKMRLVNTALDDKKDVVVQ
jgi:hypothetical protein